MTGTLVNPDTSVVPDPLRVEPPRSWWSVDDLVHLPGDGGRLIIPLVVVVIGGVADRKLLELRGHPLASATISWLRRQAQTWIRSPEPGPHAFFRLNLPISAIPQSATLWFSADQAAEPYVNGVELADTPRTQTANGTYVPRVVETLDIRPGLVVGDNVIGLEVINYDNRPPAFQARIRIESGGLVQTFGVSPSDPGSRPATWRSPGRACPGPAPLRQPPRPADWVPASAAGPGSARQRSRLRPTRTPHPPVGKPSSAVPTGISSPSRAPSTSRPVARTAGYGWQRTAPTPWRSTAGPSHREPAHGGPSVSQAVNTWSIEPLENTIPLTIYDLCPVERARAAIGSRVSVTSPIDPHRLRRRPGPRDGIGRRPFRDGPDGGRLQARRNPTWWPIRSAPQRQVPDHDGNDHRSGGSAVRHTR